MTEHALKAIRGSIQSAVAEASYVLKDVLDLLSGRRDPLIPPRRLMFDGPRDVSSFKKNGVEFLRYYTELCHLKPHEKILDVGCGIGRKTVPLTRYLEKDGRYEGFDINKTGIDWCRTNISTRYPNFNFQHVDVFNQRYNPTGKYRASEYRFPFEDESFDLVVLGSVFTHMLPEGVENYFAEVARVLKTAGGRCLISFFLLNKESLQLIQTRKSPMDFKYDMGNCRVMKADVPEHAVCYDETFIVGLYHKHGLKINQPVHYGSWCGRGEFLSYQDLVIAEKT
jgi:SAM-dependent methyltransferase